MIPKIGLLVCRDNASNTDAITAKISLEIIKEHNNFGIPSLPVLRKIAIAKKIQPYCCD